LHFVSSIFGRAQPLTVNLIKGKFINPGPWQPSRWQNRNHWLSKSSNAPQMAKKPPPESHTIHFKGCRKSPNTHIHPLIRSFNKMCDQPESKSGEIEMGIIDGAKHLSLFSTCLWNLHRPNKRREIIITWLNCCIKISGQHSRTKGGLKEVERGGGTHNADWIIKAAN